MTTVSIVSVITLQESRHRIVKFINALVLMALNEGGRAVEYLLHCDPCNPGFFESLASLIQIDH